MLEIIIIICLAAALYLLLSHYPDAHGLGYYLSAEKIGKVFARFPRKANPKKVKSIEDEISRGNQEVIAPVEIETAIASFRESDPELAKLLHEAEEAFSANDLRAAEEKSIEAITKNKRCSHAYIIIGKVAFFRGQFPDAAESFKAAVKCDKSFGEAYYWLGKIDLKEDNFSGAIENLQKAIALEKGHADWYAELGVAYMEVRQYAKAAKVLKRASSLDIDSKAYRDLAAEAEEKQRTHAMYTRYK